MRKAKGSRGGGETSLSGALNHLAHGAAQLHLAVETPERVAGWDAVVLTAASRHQAHLYGAQLEAARRRGVIGATTVTLVADDPEGQRIGSGGATLNALRRLRALFPGRKPEALRVLLIHAGGDSKRVPWANVLGKSFIPFPLFADADRPVLTVFDHLLAVSAPIAGAMPHGGLLTFSGDALPLFAASRLRIPRHGAVVVTSPVSLDVAERHGVIVAGARGRVRDLLQKLPASELVRRGALVRGCAALLDTGIYAFGGDAFRALVALAESDPDPVAELVASGSECSLYEELAAGFVPACSEWLGGRPLGGRIRAALAGHRLDHHEADGLAFVHFGSSAEVLQHVSHDWEGRLSRRVLAECGANVETTACVCASEVAGDAVVGPGSFVYASRLGTRTRVGGRCVVVGVEAGDAPCHVPDNACLWQVPVVGDGGRRCTVSVCCGVDDNPKDSWLKGTFCGRDLRLWADQHGVAPEDLWAGGEARSLWTARLFPVTERSLEAALWMLGAGARDGSVREHWRTSRRLSFSELHAVADTDELMRRQDDVVQSLVTRAVLRTIDGGLERNVEALGLQVRAGASRNELAGFAGQMRPGVRMPESRRLQMGADLLHAAGREAESASCAAAAFRAVQDEVTAAVRAVTADPVRGVAAGTCASVSLPVRFDVAGGWSDTPPYCIERPARVLNMAVTLDGGLPVGAHVEALADARWELVLEDAGGQSAVLRTGDALESPAGLRDAFALLRTALVLCGYGSGTSISQGVRVRTWARVPRGSGLGTSSILAAALVSALQQTAGRPSDPGTVIDLVLVLEQRLTTGGGWQDQVGGLVPGIKLVSSVPVVPLRPRVETVPVLPSVIGELEARFVIAFTGIERLAKNVLQIVVGRYLRRDGRVLAAIGELVALADEGRRCFALGDLDGLGRIMGRAWDVHQVLDPHCSNADVDSIFHRVSDLAVGAKLAGAGGGGFLGVMAKDERAAQRVRRELARLGKGVRVYDWSLWQGTAG